MNELGYHDRYPAEYNQLWVPCPKWIRAFYNGIAIADSRYAMLWRGRPPVYYFPRTDVRLDLLLPTDHTTKSDLLGTATYWSLTVGNRSASNAAWTYNAPLEHAPNLKGYIALEWDALDAWYEEDELVRCQPRDPYTRIDVLRSSRVVRIAIDGVTVAETTHPMLLFETGMPARYYIPRIDVRMDMLEPSDRQQECPYKGIATHYHFRLGDTVEENVAWTYPFPGRQVAGIEDMIAFYPERTSEFMVDGRQLPPSPN
jgi:uncharacterized protein (DUF427 family)